MIARTSVGRTAPMGRSGRLAPGGGFSLLIKRIWKARVSYLMLLPFLIPFVVFIVLPVVNSIYLSLTDYSGNPTTAPEFVGLENFANLLSLEIVQQPRLFDETTGEPLFQCRRERIPESQVAAYEAAEGVTCEPAFVRPRELLFPGFSEFRQVTIFNTTYLIGARDGRFWKALENTIVYVFVVVIIRTVVGLGLALVLHRQTRLNMLLRIAFFLPSVTASIAISVIWGWIFRGHSYGLINTVLLQTGLIQQPISFLADANWSMPVLVIMAVWGGIGYTMILFLAGLQNIPNEYFEAAAIDGANNSQSFWHLTLPLLRPTTVFVVITGIIGAFQVFEPIYILFATSEGLGGVLDSALTVVPYLYDEGFRLFHLGYASAIAWILFIVIFALTLINMRVGRVSEAY